MWEVIFARTPKVQRQRRRTGPVSDLERRLVERGVTASTAAQLVREHAAEMVEGKIAVFDALRQKRDRRISRSPAGFLVQSIREDYAIPPELRPEASSPVSRRSSGRDVRNALTASSNSGVVAKARVEDRSPVAEYLARLSTSERAELEAEAILQARGVAAAGYQRATASDKASLAQQYREVIIEQHLRRRR